MAAPLRYPLILLARGRWRRSICRCSPPPENWWALRAPRPTGGRCSPTRSWAGAGRHARLHAVIRRRRAADRPDHRRRPLAFGPLEAAGFPSAAAAGGTPSCHGDGGAAAVRRRGWIWQWLPLLTPPVDRYGIGLGLTMALKESAFVLWVIYGLLGEKRLADRATALKSLGYGRWQCLRWLVLPALLPALGMVLLAATARACRRSMSPRCWGPAIRPLAVLAWQWLSGAMTCSRPKGRWPACY